jgi:hypothetical protein
VLNVLKRKFRIQTTKAYCEGATSTFEGNPLCA